MDTEKQFIKSELKFIGLMFCHYVATFKGVFSKEKLQEIKDLGYKIGSLK